MILSANIAQSRCLRKGGSQQQEDVQESSSVYPEEPESAPHLGDAPGVSWARGGAQCLSFKALLGLPALTSVWLRNGAFLEIGEGTEPCHFSM